MTNQGAHENYSERETVKGSSDRSFGVVFAVVFTVIGLAPLLSGESARWWSFGVAAVFLALAILRPATLALFNRIWMRFGLLLHRIVNPIIMGVLFFLVVTPIAMLMRLTGSRPLHIKTEPEAETYWIPRDPPGPAPDTMKHQF